MSHPICKCQFKITKLLDTTEGVEWRNFHYDHAKLQSTTRTSIFLAAFGMGIMTSFQFTNPSNAPSWLVSLLSVNTIVLIAMHSFAFVIGTCLLPNLKAINEEYVPPQEGQLKMSPVPSFSPHLQFSGFIKMSHRISHVFGLFVFLLEVPLVAWVKFWDLSINAGIASTVAMAPFMVAFVLFYWYFNFEYKTQIYDIRNTAIEEVEHQYQSISREVLNASQESVASLDLELERRHSFNSELRVPTPYASRKKFHSMHNVHLEAVDESFNEDVKQE